MKRIRRLLERRREAGYIMVVTTIVLPLMLMMLALAVDVSVFYFRSVELQRAADSAALAGVTRMPRYLDADLAARDVARRNGFVNGEDNMVVQTSFPPDNNRRFTVTVRDTFVPVFFGRLIRDHWDIEKQATAEYVSSIPLGSAENALGTGYLTGSSATEGMVAGFAPQNFWLAVSGPCAAKEDGDQYSAKWDGNAVNPSRSPASTNITTKASYLCDALSTVQTPAEARTNLDALRTAKNTATPGLFPAVVANRDYSNQGYNYIVNVPCEPLTPGGPPTPPPCETGLPTGKDLVIQMYDPVFNPISVQRFVRGQVTGAGAKPDRFGLNVTPVLTSDTCFAADTAGCQDPTVSFGTGNPRPENVRVRTEVRLYAPDDSPLDYDGDVPMQVSTGPVVTAEDAPYVTGADIGATQRFGSCIRWTDGWTQRDGPFLQTAGQASAAQYNTPAAAVVPWVSEPTTWVNSTEATAANCTAYADQWVTLVRIPAATAGIERGRFRINVRTIDSVASFGTNSFGLRAFFVPTAASATYSRCTTLGTVDLVNSPCPSVSGDSSMSVFASVPAVVRFYLAQLSPAAAYRNKQVVVLLWDPGEGADQLQVLRPRRRSGGVGETVGCTPDNDVVDSDYCIQTFDWSVWNPGLNLFSAVDPLDTATAVAMNDVCLSKGQTAQTSLQISGNEDSITGCSTPQFTQLKTSRNGYQPRFGADAGRFNDRLVGVQMQVPSDYGCQIGTGTVVSGTFVDCVELSEADLAQSGWWKIKYIPKTDGFGNYYALTDRTTWGVMLLGDPVHLVNGG